MELEENNEIKTNGEKVGCVCLTYKNIDFFVHRACECFKSQTHKEKVLIVVDNSHNKQYQEAVDNAVKSLNQEGYEAVHLIEKPLVLGAYRNVGMQKAKELGCRYMATFDDDDFSSSQRLSEQIDFLKKGRYGMVFYENFIISYEFKQKLEFRCSMKDGQPPTMLVDLSLCDGLMFRFENIAEDVHFIEDFKKKNGRFSIGVLKNDFSHYVYVGYGGNITGYSHFVNMINLFNVDKK